jgi:hypothetical protein
MPNGLDATNIKSSGKEDDERNRLSLEELKEFIETSPTLKELKKSINYYKKNFQLLLEELKEFIETSPTLKELKKSINYVTPKE